MPISLIRLKMVLITQWTIQQMIQLMIQLMHLILLTHLIVQKINLLQT